MAKLGSTETAQEFSRLSIRCLTNATIGQITVLVFSLYICTSVGVSLTLTGTIQILIN